MRITRNGIESVPGPGERFTGAVYIDAISVPSDGSRLSASNVHSPGGRTARHSHPNGQTLHITEGVGLVQARGGPVDVIHAGDRVCFEAGEKHWHGAAPKRFMTHLSLVKADNEGRTAICRAHVTKEEYSVAALEESES